MDIKRYLRVRPYVLTARHLVRLALESAQGLRERRRVAKRFPQLRKLDELAGQGREKLRPYYAEYISKMSTDEMAVSLEVAVFLFVACQALKPRSILDLGSGFSSFTLRYYRVHATPEPVIWSVDDSPEWLEKTRTFLTAHQLPADNLSTWRVFIEQERGKFDLVLHDLGSMEVREQTLKKVLTLGRPGGVIILDDVHKKRYGAYARQMLDELKLQYYDLKFCTKDKFGRYSFLITP